MSTSFSRVSLTTQRDPKWICYYCMVKCTNECKLSVSQQQSRSRIPWATLKIGMELQNVGCFVTQGMRTGDASSLRGQWDVLLNSEYPTVSPRAMAAGGSASAMAGASSKPREVNAHCAHFSRRSQPQICYKYMSITISASKHRICMST